MVSYNFEKIICFAGSRKRAQRVAARRQLAFCEQDQDENADPNCPAPCHPPEDIMDIGCREISVISCGKTCF